MIASKDRLKYVVLTVSDMRFVKNFTPPEFQAKNFTPLFLPNFNSPGDKNTKKMSENGDIYTASKTFTLPPVVTNLTSAVHRVTWVTEASLIEKKPEKVLMGKIRQYLDGPNYSAIYIGIYATV